MSVVFFLQPHQAQAVASDMPDTVYWASDGSVNNIYATGTTVYAVGSFTQLYPYLGRHAAVSPTTGSTTASFPHANAAVRAVISDGAGGWYIGGDFTKIGTTSRVAVAHITSGGVVDTAFNATVSGSVAVNALVLSVDGTKLYIGGTFTTLNGTTRNRLAAVNATTGALDTSWNPSISSTVNALVLATSTNILYVGGTFTSATSTTRNRVAAFDMNTGSLTSFDANVTGGSGIVSTLAISPDSAYLYVGGVFTTVQGNARGNAAKFALSDHSLVNWDPAFTRSSSVSIDSVLVSGGVAYFGGRFSTTTNTARTNFAAYNVSDDSLASLDLRPNSNVRALAVSSDGATIYMAGSFSAFTNPSANRGFGAAFSVATGLLTGFNTNYNNLVYAMALSNDGTQLMTVGDFNYSSNTSTARNRGAAFSLTDGSILSWNPSITGGSAFRILPNIDGTKLIVGGDFTSVGGTARNRLALVSTSTGALDTSWNPSVTGGAINAMMLATSTNILYIGGQFTTATSTARSRIAAFNMNTGALTSFNPGASAIVESFALSRDSSTLYVGGQFTTISSTGRNHIAAFNTSDDSLASWNPDITGTTVYSMVPSLDGGLLYAAGSFTSVGGTARNAFAAISATSSLVNSWDFGANGSGFGLALTPSNLLYFVGSYSSILSTARGVATSIDLSSGSPSLTSWDPSIGGSASSMPLHVPSLGEKVYIAQSTNTEVPNAAITIYTDSAIDTANPSVSLTAPTASASVSGTIALSATASDNVGVAGVKLYVDGTQQGSEDTSSPFSINWDSTGAADGSHSAYAIARDAQGNTAQSSSVSFTVDNTNSMISNIATTTATTTAVITWDTDEAASSRIFFGITGSFGTSTTEIDTSPRVTSHSVTLVGLKPCALYFYQIWGRDATLNVATSSGQNFRTRGCTGGASVVSGGSDTITAASGGTLTQGRLQLTIPPSFTGTTSEAVFQANELDGTSFFATAGAPSGKNRVGNKVFNLTALTDATTSLSTFAAALTVAMEYESSDVSGVDESTLKIYRYDGSTWSALSNCSVNTGTRTVTCETTQFSDFSLFGDESSSSSSSNTGGGGGVIGGPLSVGYQVSAAEAQVQPSLSQGTTTTAASAYVFTRTLRLGMSGDDVKKLQQFLNQHGVNIRRTGPGSPGQETTYFGPITKAALIAFQEKYAAEILIPLGLARGTGLFGASTRAFVNTLMLQ